ncbi:MAG: tetratricopeptide repeat protein, partial [Planctomycetaceae bacterium]|nr:tetratricopeptide repeat protein [Planctomycetaceae bacterium]
MECHQDAQAGEIPQWVFDQGKQAKQLTKAGRYQEAAEIWEKILDQLERSLGADHIDVAVTLFNLSLIYYDQGRYESAEPLLQRALKIREKQFGANHIEVANVLCTLGNLSQIQGNYLTAEPIYLRAIEITKQQAGAHSENVALLLNNLGAMYRAQGRYDEAEPILKQAFEIYQRHNHSMLMLVCSNLGSLYRGRDQYELAEKYLQRSVQISKQKLGPDHIEVAFTQANLGSLYVKLKQYEKAELLLKNALTIWETKLGTDHPYSAGALWSLASMYRDQGLYEKAEPCIDRAIRILDSKGIAAGKRSAAYKFRAEIAWEQQRRGEALADLREAMDLAEQQRAMFSGGAQSRAESFSEYTSTFETMVQWQSELGDLGDMTQVLSAIERGKARSLLDDLLHSGTDINIGRAQAERQQFKKEEQRLKQELTVLERRLTKANQSTVEPKIIAAKKAILELENRMRTTSPVYRNLLSAGSGPLRLRQLQRDLVGDDNLLLIYMLGAEGGYLLAIDPKRARLFSLYVDEKSAQFLNCEAGPLTAERLGSLLTNDQHSGILETLSDQQKSDLAASQLAELFKILIPAELRAGLRDQSLKRLMVVPDGPLALLPFEALVVELVGNEPTYLIDVGPPVLYAPSATVMYNLNRRSDTTRREASPSVLTVGNPKYDNASTSTTQTSLTALSTKSRYAKAGGALPALPFTLTESNWIVDNFRKSGLETVQLSGVRATEAGIRRSIAGRKYLHLACHGLTDHSFGNVFGALAVTPGNQSDRDDGFLTLGEIYELNLSGCELAILSACQTNYGPRQKGEGVWSLSRGFLVAGARRVVASNWLVDDEAAASMMSY